MSNEWTAAVLGIVVVAAHVFWFFGSEHQGEVVSGLGGSVTVVGILVAAQPYIRKGVRQAAREQAGLEDPRAVRRQRDREHEAAEAEGVRHVLKERVVGVALVGGGSILNAYGPALATAI